MKKKNTIIVILVVVIALLAAVTAITVPAYLSQQKKETNQTETKEEKGTKTSTKLNNDKIESIDSIENPSDHKYDPSKKYDYIKDDQIKSLIAGLDTEATTLDKNGCGVMDFDYYKDHTIKATDLSQDMVGYVVLKHLINEGYEFKEGYVCSKDKVHEIVKSTFGKDYNYEDHTIEYCPYIEYDGNESYTTDGQSACGGSCWYSNKKKVVDFTKENDTIYIYVRVLFFDSTDSMIAYYKDYNKTEIVKSAPFTYGNEYTATLDIKDEDYYKGGLYKLTFEKEDGNFVFRTSEPVK